MPFGPEEQVNWDMDLLLAHGVLGLMIAENRDGLPLWRFHRRAARDSTGHQLSLLFYSDESTANMLFDWIESDPIIESAKSAGLLTGLINKAEAFENASSIAATSDRSWDPAIQRQWPSFIMGVSATWLGLIEELLPDAETEKETLDQKLARYHLANERLTELWREQGQHALLHHLNALFGYEALLIQRYMRF
ncbi:MAG: hypothetical protein C9356_19095 [Oleiphilus sp.]|nr:MAG: hypothetical protein C9356_19095 [Oleiphilus sp.]